MAGKIVFEGPSALDGAPIVVIATSNSANPKTGDMVQTWILRADIAPHVAVQTGDDASVCGNCPLRPLAVAAQRAAGDADPAKCYVATWRAPLAVFKCFARGGYEHATTPAARRAVGAGQMVRIGSYGDPAAVPAAVWRELLADAAGHTGYTHQHATRGNAGLTRNLRALRPLVMASVETIDQASAAHAAGWRTFRVRPYANPGEMMPGERVCPASAEAGKLVTCEQCRACSGADGRRSPGIAIIDHGPGRCAAAAA